MALDGGRTETFDLPVQVPFIPSITAILVFIFVVLIVYCLLVWLGISILDHIRVTASHRAIAAELRGYLGDVRILIPKQGEKLRVGKNTIQCELSQPPDGKLCVFSQKGVAWWPHRDDFKRKGSTNIYDVIVGLGVEGKLTIHIVALTHPLATELLTYYRKACEASGKWPSIDMGELPPGLTSLANAEVEMVKS